MNNIMISGPDGTGKSTIINRLHHIIGYEVVWLRFNHYLAKGINGIGRFLGKSYREEYSWGMVGYHDYHGVFGVLYIYAVFIDQWLFRVFLKNKKINKQNDYLIDRYIVDVIADLIVDTQNMALVLKLFERQLKNELANARCFILKCDPLIVFSRRPDVSNDRKYLDKVSAYEYISARYNIEVIDTGKNEVDWIVHKILDK